MPATMAARHAIGPLRERVEIQRKTTASDGQGGRTATWGVLETVAADLQLDGAAAEPLQAGAVTATARYRIRIRHRTDVTAAMRLRWRGLTLHILSVVSDQRRAWTWLQAAEVQG